MKSLDRTSLSLEISALHVFLVIGNISQEPLTCVPTVVGNDPSFSLWYLSTFELSSMKSRSLVVHSGSYNPLWLRHTQKVREALFSSFFSIHELQFFFVFLTSLFLVTRELLCTNFLVKSICDFRSVVLNMNKQPNHFF